MTNGKWSEIKNGISAPRGFRSTGTSCGLKDGGFKDIGLLVCENPSIVSSAFTKNKIKASPVLLDISRSDRLISAVIVNSGNANCLNGEKGDEDALKMTQMTEEKLGLEAGSAMVCSTGVIGRKLKMERVEYGIDRLCQTISHEDHPENFAYSIMTTDTRPKIEALEFEIQGKPVRIGGVAKGAGMIKPQFEMPHATMLVFLTTDIKIARELLDEALETVIQSTFNRMSVDNDMSTNDTVLLLSSCLAENDEITEKDEDYQLFLEALTELSLRLVKLLVRDGEGVTKLVHVIVDEAFTQNEAEKVARAVSDSFLVKTAIHGQSPNWGRILSALGYSGVSFNLEDIKLYFNDLLLFENGTVNRQNEGHALSEMIQKELSVKISLGKGNQSFDIWTSDLTCEYIKINANYMS